MNARTRLVGLRYGQLYGPGTYFEQEKPPSPHIHVDEAAVRAVPALSAPSGVIELTEEEAGTGEVCSTLTSAR